MAADEIEFEFGGCKLNDPATEGAVVDLERETGFRLPLAYREFMLRSNGLEGFIGKRHYLVLWPVERIAELNAAYGVSEFAPGLLLIGSDGGDSAYAFDTRLESSPLVEVPFIGMSLNELKRKDSSFAALLSRLRMG